MTIEEAFKAQDKFASPVLVWRAADPKGAEYGYWEARIAGTLFGQIEAAYFDPAGIRLFRLFFSEPESFLAWVKETL